MHLLGEGGKVAEAMASSGGGKPVAGGSSFQVPPSAIKFTHEGLVEVPGAQTLVLDGSGYTSGGTGSGGTGSSPGAGGGAGGGTAVSAGTTWTAGAGVSYVWTGSSVTASGLWDAWFPGEALAARISAVCGSRSPGEFIKDAVEEALAWLEDTGGPPPSGG